MPIRRCDGPEIVDRGIDPARVQVDPFGKTQRLAVLDPTRDERYMWMRVDGDCFGRAARDGNGPGRTDFSSPRLVLDYLRTVIPFHISIPTQQANRAPIEIGGFASFTLLTGNSTMNCEGCRHAVRDRDD